MKKNLYKKGLVFGLVLMVVCTTIGSATKNIIDSTLIETNHQEYEVESGEEFETGLLESVIGGLVLNLESDGNIHTFNALLVGVINVTEFIDWVINGCDLDDLGWITLYYSLEKFTIEGKLKVLGTGPYFGFVSLIVATGKIISIEPQ